MPIVESEIALLHDQRLAVLATSAYPAWLWSADPSRILWANAIGAAILGAEQTSELRERCFDARRPPAAQVAALAVTLSAAKPERFERLRGFDVGFGRALTCACSRVVLADGTTAVLLTATEPVGPRLVLGERVRRLFADRQAPIAVFTPAGALLHANAAALSCLGGTTALAALDIEVLATRALETGSAGGAARSPQGSVEVSVHRLGEAASRVVMVAFLAQSGIEDVAAPTPAPMTAPPDAAGPSPPQRRALGDGPGMEQRRPLRFAWQMDADGRFVVGSDEFATLVGSHMMTAFARPWSEIATALTLDPDHEVARAVARQETFSGITVLWPVDGTSERLLVELSGLPAFDRARKFRGYRGFGVCRDVARINRLLRVRRESPAASTAVPGSPLNVALLAEAAPGADALQSVALASLPAGPSPHGLQPSAAGVARVEAPTEVPSPGSSPSLALSVIPGATNVVPFRLAPSAEAKPPPSLSAVERTAFRELAQELTERLHGPQQPPAAAANASKETLVAARDDTPTEGLRNTTACTAAQAPSTELGPLPPGAEQRLLDRIPIGLLVYRHDSLIYANRHFLEWSGYENLGALAGAGGVGSLFAEPGTAALGESGGTRSLSIVTQHGDRVPAEGRLFTIPWNGQVALALVLTNSEAEKRLHATECARQVAESKIRELQSVVEASEREMRKARREAQRAIAAKARFLAKLSHEIRTPLNALSGFAEVMMTERFGPLGNQRYRDYLKDMHAAGTYLLSLLNDLLDLSKIESGLVDLTLADINLNDLTDQCVGSMQPQANRAGIIIRTSLALGLPRIVADERLLRQIVLNLLANSIRFTGPGGQVIISTAYTDGGEVVLRVRDTGVRMSEPEVEAAPAREPFWPTGRGESFGSGGMALGLSLTKAMAEANRANFSLKTAPNAGTLVEIAFPLTGVVAK
ncbi:MAG TPA: histidine kinase dimerization/phospho-acceptor domain-containing protein [Xanthobacteraceae bacterium]